MGGLEQAMDRIRSELRTELAAAVQESRAAELLQKLDHLGDELREDMESLAPKYFGGAAPAGGSAPAPYELRWQPAANSGNGGWAIYLPTGHLLSYRRSNYDTSDIEGTTPLGGMDGWYEIDGGGAMPAGHVGPSVERAALATAPSAAADDPGNGTRTYNVCVAEIVEEPGGTSSVRQSLVGALHLGGEGAAEGEPEEDPEDPYVPTDPADPEYPTPDDPDPEDDPEGITGNVTVLRKLVCNENGNRKVQFYLKTMHYFKGRVTQVRNLPNPVDVFTLPAGADVSALNGLKLVADFEYGASTSYNIRAVRNELVVANGVVSVKNHDNNDDRNIPTTPHSTSS